MGDYEYRSGTRENFGFEYEDQMIAYLAVAACNRKDLKDFWIASNVDGVGAWDDIIIYIETFNGCKVVQFIQLKHKADDSKSIKFKDFKDDIKKYIKDFEDLKKLVLNDETNQTTFKTNQTKFKKHQTKFVKILKNTEVQFKEMQFILMTNGNFNKHERLLPVSKDFFIMTNADGPVYQMSPSNIEDNNEIDFTKQFFIVSCQSGVTDEALLNNIETHLNQFLNHKNFKLAEDLPTIIKDVFISRNHTLSLLDLKESISYGMLLTMQYTKPRNSKYPTLNQDEWARFKQIIEPYQLIVISNNLIFNNFFGRNGTHFLIECAYEEIELVINCLRDCQHIKVILLITNEARCSIMETQINTLNSLNKLPEESLVLLNDYKVNIQGRETNFETFLNLHPDMKDILTVDDILNLLSNKLSFGENCDVPQYYVSRFIPRIFVKKSMIVAIPNSYFILIVENNVVESELKICSCLNLKFAETDLRKNFECVKHNTVNEALLNVKREFKYVHILKYHQKGKEFVLEWIYSKANVYEIKNFIEDENFYIKPIGDNLSDISSLNYIQRTVIVANPGMGKTCLIKHIANNYNVESWVMLVTLNQINFETVNSFQIYLNNYIEKLSCIDKQIFKLYLTRPSVVVLFDGFDEVSPLNESEAIHLIKGASEQGLKIVVTSREVTKEVLEQNLNVLSYSIKPFSKQDKMLFLERFYFGNICNTESCHTDAIKEKIKIFATKLLDNCSLSSWDEEFTGVPLQCRLLAEGFNRECQQYCKTNDLNPVCKSLNLITLYESFIDNKFNIFIKEKENMEATGSLKVKVINDLKKQFLENHLQAAAQIIFPQFGINISEEFVEEMEKAEVKYGIITGVDENKKPVFIHRTFAEYFAAKWLIKVKQRETCTQITESQRDEYLNILLKSQYNIVHDLFDKMLCKDCDLHMAVLNWEVNNVKDILEKNEGHDEGKCGRSALHILSTRGAKHVKTETDIDRKGDEKYLVTLNLLIEKGFWNDTVDDVLRWTPQEYADHRRACGVIDKLLEYKRSKLYNLENSFIKLWDVRQILAMCAKYDYISIGTNFVDLTEIELSETAMLLKSCAENGSAKFAEKLIRCKALNSCDLMDMTFDYLGEKITLLHVAAQNGREKVIEILLPYIDVDIIDSLGRTALHWACDEKHPSSVQVLVERGAKLFLPDHKKIAPIEMAFDGALNSELTEFITRYDILKTGFGDDVNARLPGYNKGRTPLHYAAGAKNLSTLKRLISEGANVNNTDAFGETPLHMMYEKALWDTDIVQILIESDLDINAQDISGETALHVAASWSTKEMLESLLKFGINTNIVDRWKRTALSVSREQGEDEAFLMLWETTQQKSELDELYKSVLAEGDNVEVRRRTFLDFPQQLSRLIESMAQAGLYYFGNADWVKCFTCDCLVLNWSPKDDPWKRHAIEEPTCEFLRQEKGLEFIRSCQKSKSAK